jgi:hypothetical protein
MALRIQRLTEAEEMTKADDVLRLEVGGCHSEERSGAAHILFGEVNKASDFAAFLATGLARKPKTFHDVPPVLARLYNPNREKYICRSELQERISARIRRGTPDRNRNHTSLSGR